MARGTGFSGAWNRRKVLRGGASVMTTWALAGCGETGVAGANMRSDDHAGGTHEMPLESARHERTFMQWPTSLDTYGARDLAKVQAAVARIANTVVQHEPVVMLAAAEQTASARRLLSAAVETWDIPTDDLWCRDSGPTFVRGADGKLAVAHLVFNGWGGKQACPNDALIAPRVAERLGLPLLATGLIGEQGGVEHDGDGTLLAHASCWVNPNRNNLSQDEIGKRLLAALGGRKMIWTPGIKGQDITDFHIDALARFVGPGKLLIQLGETVDRDDPWSVAGHETLQLLRSATTADGKPLDIIRLDDPADIRSRRKDFVASYVNYYVANGAVIAPQFGDRRADAKARELLASLYPGRTVEMIEIDAIGESGGGIHCATQQQPAS